MGVLAPGTMLGGCRIDAVLGRGGMGVVYRARQIDLDREVAVKVVAPELTEDPESRARFLREARAAGAVEHPNVVPVHGAGVADGQGYLVMRYIAGDDLRAVVHREGPFTPAAAAAVTAQLGDALDAIHRSGYVHRDVKPRNVMIDVDGHAYLTDFGLAKLALASTGPTSAAHWVGTLDYVAPEQIRGDRVGPAADVYALGGVLYFMLTAHVPFARESDHAKLWAHLHDEPPRPAAERPELPGQFDAIVRRALAKDPALRHPSAGELGRAARAAAAGDGSAGSATARTTITAPRPSAQALRAPRRRAAGIALALLVVLGGSAALVLRAGTERDGGRHAPPARATPTPPSARSRSRPSVDGVSVGPSRPLGFRPRDVAVAGGKAWVIGIHEPRVLGVDAESLQPGRRAPYVGAGAVDIARDREVVWVAVRRRREVVGFDARTGRLTRVPTGSPPIRVAADSSGLWVAVRAAREGPVSVLRFDRDGAGPLDQPLALPDGIGAIALGGGYLWISSPEPGKHVLRIAPGGVVEPSVWLGAPTSGLAYGAGALWATQSEAESVVRFDLDTKRAPTTAVGLDPTRVVVTADRVFASVSGDHKVVLLKPRTGRKLGRLRVPKNPGAIAAGAGHVFVIGLGDYTLTRLDP